MVQQCPRCGGSGTECNGSLVIGSDRIVSTPPSKCIMCNGQRAVVIRPADDDEAKIAFATAFILDTRIGGP